MQNERDRRTHMAAELKDDLQKKIELSKQMESEQYNAHERISQLEEQINVLSR